MTGAEVRRRAGTALATMGIRQLAIRGIALAGTVVLAHLLLPRDLGVVAIGTTLAALFTFAGDGGIAAGLIRRPRAPERPELQTFLGIQLAVTALLALATFVIGARNGLVGGVTAIMVASVPVAALRSPAIILFERDLRYRPLVLIDLIDTITYYVWAIATVLAGWGVWGLGSALLVRTAVGSVVMTFISPAGFMLPALSLSRLRGLLAFGLQYQAVGVIAAARDPALNFGIAAIAGVATLGLWSLVYRILQLPFMVFEVLWRVSYPAMARLLAAGEDATPIMERGVAISGLITGGLLTALVGSTPALVPAVFGEQWSPVTSVIPWAAAGLMFGGPVSVATSGYLYAIGDGVSVLIAVAVDTIIWLALGLLLVRTLGVQAIGMAWFAASVAESIILARRTRRRAPIRVFRSLLLPAAVGAAAALAGWTTTVYLGPTLISAVAGAAIAGALYAGTMFVIRRSLVMDAIGLVRRSTASVLT
jgi:O-antigen/teichoic acid export membrane protein